MGALGLFGVAAGCEEEHGHHTHRARTRKSCLQVTPCRHAILAGPGRVWESHAYSQAQEEEEEKRLKDKEDRKAKKKLEKEEAKVNKKGSAVMCSTGEL